jgi:two-component system C4-dicarboxylate transport sensor histidine kinase DctB
VIWLYLGAAVVAISVLVWGLVTDRRYDEERSEQRLLLETQARSRYLGHHLRLLSEELRRLGVRTEVDLLDENLAPERSLIALAHEDSTFFNLGVAILDAQGAVLWAQPDAFLPRTRKLGRTGWFMDMRMQPGLSFVAVEPDDKDAIMYVVAPLLRAGAFTGAIIGGVDLATSPAIEGHVSERSGETVLANARGEVVFPGEPPAYAGSTEWRALFAQQALGAPIQEVVLGGRTAVVASAPIGVAGFTLLSVIDRARLFEPAALRLRTRLLLGLGLAVAPLIGLVYLLRRSLLAFRRSEEAAVREDRLRRLGEASNLIAHEVRNSLNGLRIGMDLVLDGKHERPQRVVSELRAEIERLSSFAHELMLFAKDPTPHKEPADLSHIVKTALNLTIDLADELGVRVELCGTEQPVPVEVDPTLIRIVLSNLISNALDALATLQNGSDAPRMTVTVECAPRLARVRVADNGPGVSYALQQSLFEPFVTSKPSGVGIGLALARKIARAHGGDLRLEPTVRGASFVLELQSEAR